MGVRMKMKVGSLYTFPPFNVVTTQDPTTGCYRGYRESATGRKGSQWSCRLSCDADASVGANKTPPPMLLRLEVVVARPFSGEDITLYDKGYAIYAVVMKSPCLRQEYPMQAYLQFSLMHWECPRSRIPLRV